MVELTGRGEGPIVGGFSFLRRPAFAFLGIEERPDGLVWTFRSLFLAAGRLWAVVLLGALTAIFTFSVARFEYFSPTSLVEEAAHTYTSANNYLRFGVWQSILLQDFSTSGSPEDRGLAAEG